MNKTVDIIRIILIYKYLIRVHNYTSKIISLTLMLLDSDPF